MFKNLYMHIYIYLIQVSYSQTCSPTTTRNMSYCGGQNRHYKHLKPSLKHQKPIATV